jgi:hypothetical protein
MADLLLGIADLLGVGGRHPPGIGGGGAEAAGPAALVAGRCAAVHCRGRLLQAFLSPT